MDFFGDWLKQASVTLILLWGIGTVAERVLAPHSLRRDALLIAPLFGFSIISAVGHYLGSLHMPAQSFAWLLGLLAVVAPLGLAIQRKLELNWRSHVPIIAVCIVAYLVAIAPLIQLGYLTTVGNTIDGISYAVRSEYLREAGLVSPIISPGHPFYGWAALQINTLRVGDVYIGLDFTNSAAHRFHSH